MSILLSKSAQQALGPLAETISQLYILSEVGNSSSLNGEDENENLKNPKKVMVVPKTLPDLTPISTVVAKQVESMVEIGKKMVSKNEADIVLYREITEASEMLNEGSICLQNATTSLKTPSISSTEFISSRRSLADAAKLILEGTRGMLAASDASQVRKALALIEEIINLVNSASGNDMGPDSVLNVIDNIKSKYNVIVSLAEMVAYRASDLSDEGLSTELSALRESFAKNSSLFVQSFRTYAVSLFKCNENPGSESCKEALKNAQTSKNFWIEQIIVVCEEISRILNIKNVENSKSKNNTTLELEAAAVNSSDPITDSVIQYKGSMAAVMNALSRKDSFSKIQASLSNLKIANNALWSSLPAQHTTGKGSLCRTKSFFDGSLTRLLDDVQMQKESKVESGFNWDKLSTMVSRLNKEFEKIVESNANLILLTNSQIATNDLISYFGIIPTHPNENEHDNEIIATSEDDLKEETHALTLLDSNKTNGKILNLEAAVNVFINASSNTMEQTVAEHLKSSVKRIKALHPELINAAKAVYVNIDEINKDEIGDLKSTPSLIYYESVKKEWSRATNELNTFLASCTPTEKLADWSNFVVDPLIDDLFDSADSKNPRQFSNTVKLFDETLKVGVVDILVQKELNNNNSKAVNNEEENEEDKIYKENITKHIEDLRKDQREIHKHLKESFKSNGSKKANRGHHSNKLRGSFKNLQKTIRKHKFYPDLPTIAEIQFEEIEDENPIKTNSGSLSKEINNNNKLQIINPNVSFSMGNLDSSLSNINEHYIILKQKPIVPLSKEEAERNPIKAAAVELQVEAGKWAGHNNNIIQLAVKISQSGASLNELCTHSVNKTSEIINVARAIYGDVNEFTKICIELASHCKDSRLKNNLLKRAVEKLPTLSQQLKILSAVKVSFPLDRGTQSQLVTAATNLMETIKLGVKLSESASIRCDEEIQKKFQFTRQVYRPAGEFVSASNVSLVHIHNSAESLISNNKK